MSYRVLGPISDPDRRALDGRRDYAKGWWYQPGLSRETKTWYTNSNDLSLLPAPSLTVNFRGRRCRQSSAYFHGLPFELRDVIFQYVIGMEYFVRGKFIYVHAKKDEFDELQRKDVRRVEYSVDLPFGLRRLDRQTYQHMSMIFSKLRWNLCHLNGPNAVVFIRWLAHMTQNQIARLHFQLWRQDPPRVVSLMQTTLWSILNKRGAKLGLLELTFDWKDDMQLMLILPFHQRLNKSPRPVESIINANQEWASQSPQWIDLLLRGAIDKIHIRVTKMVDDSAAPDCGPAMFRIKPDAIVAGRKCRITWQPFDNEYSFSGIIIIQRM